MSEQLSAYEQQRVAYAQAHLAALAFIDRHLFEPLDLERVARAAGYSPWEFSRRFARMQGESVMAYVRGRRLETAAARLVADPQARLIELALECGFTSQAAFTRAFTRAFGEAPGRLRRSVDGASMLRRRRAAPGTRAPVLAERIEQLPELALVGLSGRFSPANYVEFAALWERQVALRQAAGRSRRDESFGVFSHREPGGAFEFVAASRAWADVAPAPLERVTLPAGRYLVFRHHMHEGSMLPQMNAAQESIGRARHRVGATWDFEHYPANFGEVRWIDHYLPLEADMRRVARPAPGRRAGDAPHREWTR
ncbi:GyrI-like small molecule binding domain-containing protein [Nannocystis exedens]|uniref:GyrI-like small molecule binding domain-containing protein n=1 Tax=Nannocystis exedens TaxID=54 RepID=A0A1I2E0L8_9BACT|nr:AraC family transcriptional regulator [Nannocystis exedens]PCC69190.1 AraC family transcriptional regulator [Nannocystis exedens]SFE86133.1 GyrI-like small molecule binding domain-containing protein [Nannocystis exedens]